jgi:hypothetical protein
LFGHKRLFFLNRNTNGIAYFEESFQALIAYVFILALKIKNHAIEIMLNMDPNATMAKTDIIMLFG